MTGPPTGRAAELARHRDHLVRIAYRLLGSVDEAEDVVQDVGAAVLAFVVRDGRVAQVDVVANPDKLGRISPGPGGRAGTPRPRR